MGGSVANANRFARKAIEEHPHETPAGNGDATAGGRPAPRADEGRGISCDKRGEPRAGIDPITISEWARNPVPTR